MNRSGEDRAVSVPNVLLGAVTVATVAVIVVALSTSSVAFSLYNSDWDGTSSLRSTATETEIVVNEATQYSSVAPNETVAFVLSPNSAYSPTEAAHVEEFVRSGGTLVVAGDFDPHTNQLLRALNASARLNGHPLRDVQSNYRSSAMPVTTEVSNRSLVAGVDSLTLNYGTTVEPRGAEVLVNTSEYAYLDTDRSGQLSGNESLRTYSVATVESIGDGRVVVVSDPSVFINSMTERLGNHQFVRALLAPHDTLLLDYSHASGLPPLVLVMLTVRESALLQLGLGVLAITAFGVWSRQSDLVPDLPVSALWWFRRDSPPDVRASREELATYLKRRRPDWDDERIERVVSAVKRHQRRD